MSWFDILLLAIIAIYTITGLAQGLVKQLFNLFGFLIVLALAFIGSRMLSGYVASFLDPAALLPYWEVIHGIGVDVPVDRILQMVAGVIAFLALFVILQIFFRLIAAGFKSINQVPVVGLFNRIGGGVIGLFIGIFLAYTVVSLASLVPLQFCVDALDNSRIAVLAEQYLPPVTAALKEFFLKCFLHTVSGGEA
jgi:uncharacterized membrane protein required for colicin V production